MYTDVMNFIDLFHPAEQEMVGTINDIIYSHGQCFRFAQMLCRAFAAEDARIVGTGTIPKGTKYHDLRAEILRGTYNHYYACINECYYDINGCAGETAADLGVDEQIHDINEFTNDDVHRIEWLAPYFNRKQTSIESVKLMRILTHNEIVSVLAHLKSHYHNELLDKSLLLAVKDFNLNCIQKLKEQCHENQTTE